MIKLMDREFIFISMGRNMRGSGRMINKMASELKYGQMERNMKGSMRMAKNKEKGF